VKHLQTKKSCPECGKNVHETQPLLNLRSDRVMQDVVYKLVPNLFQGRQIDSRHMSHIACLHKSKVAF